MEEALTAKKRNSLDNSKFALVYKDDKGKTIRKYPVHDKAHVQAASKMFPRGVPEKYQGKVARRILAEAREYKLDTSGWDNVNKAADKKVVQEFEDPIKSLQEATSGSMNFMNHLMTINLLNSGSVQESLKQLSRNNLKPVMFMGFMDPDNVNRCEYKDLEKHVIYATDNGTLYASFFNSFSRTKEISEIALSLDSFINDLPNKKVSQEHIPTHMSDCMISLSDEGRTIHSRGNVPMKLEYEDAFFMNAYYSYFAVYEAFEFKKNSLYKDISKVILSQLDGDESHFDFESVDVTQETFGSAKIHIRFRYDDDPYVVVIPTESMKTLPAKLYRESARDTDTEGSGEMNNTEETPIQEQEEVDENGLIKVKNIPSDMMYFGSFKDFGNNMLKLSKPRLFVTPYMGIASIFTVDRSRYNIPPGESVNLAYDEWNSDDNEEPFEEIHTIVEGIPDFPERSFESTGWIYGVDISKYKDNIYQESWMNPEKEFLIIDVPELPIAKKIRHEMIVNVRGGELRKVPQKEVVQESIASALPGHRFDAMMDHMRRRVDLRNHFLIFKHQHGLNKSFLKRTKLQLENISDGREPFMLLGFLTVGDVRHTPVKDLDRHTLYKASDGVYTKLLNTKGELEKVAETGTEFIDSFDSVRVPVANIPERMQKYCDVYMYRDDVIRAMIYGMTLIPAFAFINTYLFQSNVPIEFIHKSDTVSMHTYYAYFAAYETMGYCLAGLGRKIWLLVAKVWGEFSQPSFRKITIKEESDTKTSVVASIISRDRGFDLKFTIENFESVYCEILNEDGSKVKWFHKYTKPITIRESEGMDPEDYEDIHDHLEDEDDIYNESWTDFKNGVHPSSGLMFHVSLKDDMDGKEIKPQLPSYITDGGELNDNYKEDTETKRLCVSPSIEGCLMAIMNYKKLKKHIGDKLYVYTPEKPFSQYKHKTNKEIVKDKLVFDANITKEAWILEPCKLKLYGIIRLKKVDNLKEKSTVEKDIKVNVIDVDYEWLMKPKAVEKFNSSPIQESGDMKTTKGYRYTDGRSGEGIYDALNYEMYQRNGLSPSLWLEFLNSDACKWLPKPPKYDDNNESWFTEEGNEKFKKLTLPTIKKYIKNVKMETKNIPNAQIVYSDEYQFIINKDIRIQEGAYTNSGINRANVHPVKMVYQRFSTKNKEQLEPIKKFWEISDKYFPEPHMTGGFGWDWTGWETDFAYGIIINEDEIPPEFMEELKAEFPDMILDENFLIPNEYEETYECTFEEMDATYDKIWAKGFLECELEEYPALGKMKISVIYKKDADELNKEISKYIKTVDEPDTVQEAFFGIGFGNLRKTIADKLGAYCTVTNVQNPTGKEEKFVVKSKENPEDFINVISTGNGVKAYGYKNSERFSIFNNASLSAAAQKLIDAICDEFNIKLSVQEAFSMFIDDEVSPRQ